MEGYRKVMCLARLDSNEDGTTREYPLAGRPGGRHVRAAQYMIRVFQTSTDNAEVGLRLDHSPDGTIYTPAGTAIAQVEVSPDTVVSGTVGTADLSGTGGSGQPSDQVLGEWLRPAVLVGSGTTGAKFVTVEVHEVLKPY